MPPKRASSRRSSKPSSSTTTKPTKTTLSGSSKRKDPPTKQASTAKRSRKAPPIPLKSPADPLKTLNFLLSDAAHSFTTHQDEVEAAKTLRTYTSVIPLTPFEELLSAVILSRPISHRLGQRSIRTVLNPDFNFTTPRAILDAGPTRVHQALEKARTQHKAKTAEQIGLFAGVAKQKFADHARDQQLNRLKDEAEGDVDALREMVTSNVKGAGKTAMNIFLRRIQSLWSDYYPFMDERTADSLKKLGLPTDATKFSKMLQDKWSDLETAHIRGEDEESKKRMAFVLALERATGADLEGRLNEVIEQVERR